ncbi:MAG: hypothetical protein ACT4O1_02300 [Gemmatimonadota bacterium]
MSDERIDFSALDIERDRQRIERMVGSVLWRARAELARRAATQNVGVVEAVAAWFRPAIAAAAAIAAISVAMLATVGRSSPETQTGAYMSSAFVPAAMTSWYEEDRLPTAAELMVAVQGED